MTVFYSCAPNWTLHCWCVTSHQNRVCYPLQLWTENLVASMVMLFWLILWLLMQLLCCWCPISFVQSAIVARFRIQSLWWIRQVQSFVETQIKSVSNFNALFVVLPVFLYLSWCADYYLCICIYRFCDPSKHSSFVDTLNCISIPFNMVVWFASLLFSTSFQAPWGLLW